MRSFIALTLLAILGCQSAWADEKPKPVSTVELVSALEPATTKVHAYAKPGVLPALAKRCPNLVELKITWNSKLELADLKSLEQLGKLTALTVTGDMSFPTSHFEVLGKLKQLKTLRLALY